MFGVKGPENRIPVCGVLEMDPAGLAGHSCPMRGHQDPLADMDITRAMPYAGAVLCAVTEASLGVSSNTGEHWNNV